MWNVLFVVLLSLIIAAANTSAPNILCCPEGMAVLVRNDSCWELLSNTTSKTLLSFDPIFRFLRYFFDSDGELVVYYWDDINGTIGSNEYCLANVTMRFDRKVKNVVPMALVCNDQSNKNGFDQNASGYCMIISAIFLLLTAAIYVALPQMRDLEGKCIISFCCTFAPGLLIMGAMKMTTYSDMTFCAIRGFVVYFCTLSAIFWTNAIALQILRSVRWPTTTRYKRKDYAWLAVYSWGTPGAITLILVVLNYVPGVKLRPGIGLNTCWFYDKKPIWYYMYSFWSVLVVANICIFIYIAIFLWRIKLATSNRKDLKYKFLLTVRLVIVMGVSWIFELISSLVDYHIFWLIADGFNLLQGEFMFLVLVVFRKRVVKAMYRQGWLDCISGPVERYLAKTDDDKQDAIEHNRDVPLEDR